MRDKVILVDCDGVLLDWEYHFYKWVKAEKSLTRKFDHYRVSEAIGISTKAGHKLVQEFNSSGDMKYLSPLRDAIKYVRKLHEEHGYIFHVITSQTHNQMARNWRMQNLHNVFGDVFDGITILGTGEDKDEELAKWEGTNCWWVEDKPANIVMGNEFGLEGILMSHIHNQEDIDGHRVQNWKEIYSLITGDL